MRDAREERRIEGDNLKVLRPERLMKSWTARGGRTWSLIDPTTVTLMPALRITRRLRKRRTLGLRSVKIENTPTHLSRNRIETTDSAS